MAGNVTGLHRFADDVGPIPLSLLDTNFDALTQTLNTLATFSNFYVDTGTTNALTVTVPSTQFVSYSDGLTLSVRVAATNTGAATLNVNTLGAQPIQNANGSGLSAGQLQAGSIATFVYSASRNAWQLGGGGGGGGGLSGSTVAPFLFTDSSGAGLVAIYQPPLPQYAGILTIGPGSAPVNGPTLVVDGSPNQNACEVSGALNSATGNWLEHIFFGGTFRNPGIGGGIDFAQNFANGILLNAGTTASDWTCAFCNAINSAIYFGIRGDGSGSLGPAPNQLVWDSAGHFTLTGTATLPGGGGGGVSYLSQLLDVSLTSQINGQVLSWNGSLSRWVNVTLPTPPPPGSTTLAGLTDVAITSPAANQVLTYSGGHWINAAPTGGGGGSSSSLTAPVTISPGSSTSLTLTNSANQDGLHVIGAANTSQAGWLATFIGSAASTPGMSEGVEIQAGLSYADVSFRVMPANVNISTGLPVYFNISGDGSGSLGPAPNQMTWTPSSGFRFTSGSASVPPLSIVSQPATTPGIYLWQVGGGGPSGSSPGCANGLYVAAGTNANDNAVLVKDDTETYTYFQVKGDGSGLQIGEKWDVHGMHTFGPPVGTGATNICEQVRGPPNTTPGWWFVQIGGGASGSTVGCSNGLYIGAGTNNSDFALWIQNDAGTADYMTIRGDGSGSLGPYPNQMTWDSSGNFKMTGSAVAPHFALAQALDISFSTLADGQALVWNAATGKWINATLSGSGGPVALSGLTDVLLTSPVATQVLTYDGTHWINQTPVAHTLATLTDVALATPTAGQMLVRGASTWANSNTIASTLTVQRSSGGAVSLAVTGGTTPTLTFSSGSAAVNVLAVTSAPSAGSGQVTVDQSTSINNDAFYVHGAASTGTAFMARLMGSATAGSAGSNGLAIQAGTVSGTDWNLLCTNKAGANLFRISGDSVFLDAVSADPSKIPVLMDGSNDRLYWAGPSGARFKTDVRSLPRDYARKVVSGLRAISYRYNSRVRVDDPAHMYYGLIADEVAKVDPLLVGYDDAGRPATVMYDRIALLLLPLVQELLEARA